MAAQGPGAAAQPSRIQPSRAAKPGPGGFPPDRDARDAESDALFEDYKRRFEHRDGSAAADADVDINIDPGYLAALARINAYWDRRAVEDKRESALSAARVVNNKRRRDERHSDAHSPSPEHRRQFRHASDEANERLGATHVNDQLPLQSLPGEAAAASVAANNAVFAKREKAELDRERAREDRAAAGRR